MNKQKFYDHEKLYMVSLFNLGGVHGIMTPTGERFQKSCVGLLKDYIRYEEQPTVVFVTNSYQSMVRKYLNDLGITLLPGTPEYGVEIHVSTPLEIILKCSSSIFRVGDKLYTSVTRKKKFLPGRSVKIENLDGVHLIDEDALPDTVRVGGVNFDVNITKLVEEL